MHTITLSRGFSKQGLLILFFIVVLAEVVGWSGFPDQKRIAVERLGGVVPYLSRLAGTLLLPESVSVILLTSLMYWLRRLLAINSVERSWLSIVRYELVFLPLFVVVFFLIIPFTQSVRYLTENYPGYSFAGYWQDYMLYIYNWYVYFKYLVPLLLIGYGTLNISLLLDYFRPISIRSKR